MPGVQILVSDFDGTMTYRDFYHLVLQELIQPDTPDFWQQYCDGQITHFQALQGYFAAIGASKSFVEAQVDQLGIDPLMADVVQRLKTAGWQVIVASAGCRWYIDRLLKQAGVDIEVYANPGEFVDGHGLQMQLPPQGSAFRSEKYGVHKAGIVQHYLSRGQTVAFAGDGVPDAEAARLVPEHLRFARGSLARVLDDEGLRYRPFQRWSEIALQILASGVEK